MKLSTTKAVITGGASGLGEATARYFAGQGAKVCLLDRDATKGPVVAEELGGAFFETDVTDECSVAAAIVGAVDAMGGITACVNCVGVGTAGKTIGKDGPCR